MCFVLLGCGAGGNVTPTPTPLPPTKVYAVNGEWNFDMQSKVTSGLLLDFGGNLTTVGSTVSGTLFAVPGPELSGYSSTCVDLLAPLKFTGTINSSTGALQLVSEATHNQTITISVTLESASGAASGSYSIASVNTSQPSCQAGDTGSVSSTVMHPVSGTYTGTITPTGGTPFPATLQVNEDTMPDTFQMLHFSGSLTVSNWSCFVTGPIITTGDGTSTPSTFAEGVFALLSIKGNNPAATFAANVYFAPDGKSIRMPLFVLQDGPCSMSDGSATFTQI